MGLAQKTCPDPSSRPPPTHPHVASRLVRIPSWRLSVCIPNPDDPDCHKKLALTSLPHWASLEVPHSRPGPGGLALQLPRAQQLVPPHGAGQHHANGALGAVGGDGHHGVPKGAAIQLRGSHQQGACVPEEGQAPSSLAVRHCVCGGTAGHSALARRLHRLGRWMRHRCRGVHPLGAGEIAGEGRGCTARIQPAAVCLCIALSACGCCQHGSAGERFVQQAHGNGQPCCVAAKIGHVGCSWQCARSAARGSVQQGTETGNAI